jgi:hypothetical protein
MPNSWNKLQKLVIFLSEQWGKIEVGNRDKYFPMFSHPKNRIFKLKKAGQAPYNCGIRIDNALELQFHYYILHLKQ